MKKLNIVIVSFLFAVIPIFGQEPPAKPQDHSDQIISPEKVKIFLGSSYQTGLLEEDINKWLEEQKGRIIIWKVDVVRQSDLVSLFIYHYYPRHWNK